MGNLGKSHCLVSQQIRDEIKKGNIYTGFSNLKIETRNGKERFVDADLEAKIQAASFEPSIDDELFIVDTQKSGLIRPRPNQSVREILKGAGALQERISSTGYEVKKGHSYAIRLRDKINPRLGGFTKASPKSSSGRLFFDVRHSADHNPCFDEINPEYKSDKLVEMYLFSKPLAFNQIIYPGDAFNQLRFFRGFDAQLTPGEVHKRKEELYKKSLERAIITSGLQIHLGLPGKKKSIKVLPGKKYLLASKEILTTPLDLSCELLTTSDKSFRGKWDFAGFIDPPFEGNLVYELESDEEAEIWDGMPVSDLLYFRTAKITDKPYGEGSNYQGQSLIKPAKQFKATDLSKISALMARDNPRPIDTRKKGEYKVDEYFYLL